MHMLKKYGAGFLKDVFYQCLQYKTESTNVTDLQDQYNKASFRTFPFHTFEETTVANYIQFH